MAFIWRKRGLIGMAASLPPQCKWRIDTPMPEKKAFGQKLCRSQQTGQKTFAEERRSEAADQR